jgi:hypothetical protein
MSMRLFVVQFLTVVLRYAFTDGKGILRIHDETLFQAMAYDLIH